MIPCRAYDARLHTRLRIVDGDNSDDNFPRRNSRTEEWVHRASPLSHVIALREKRESPQGVAGAGRDCVYSGSRAKSQCTQ